MFVSWFGSGWLADSRMQVNVGTSGAEIGAAFGGNKVSSLTCEQLNAFLTHQCLSVVEHRLVSSVAQLVVDRGSQPFQGPRVRWRCMETVCALECMHSKLFGCCTSGTRRRFFGVTERQCRTPPNSCTTRHERSSEMSPFLFMNLSYFIHITMTGIMSQGLHPCTVNTRYCACTITRIAMDSVPVSDRCRE